MRSYQRLVCLGLLFAAVALTACGRPTGSGLDAAAARAGVAGSSAVTSAASSRSPGLSSPLGVVPTLEAQGATAAPLRSLPGNDPAIQKWFQQIDAVKIAFDAALFSAEQGIAAGRAADCQSLARQSTALLKLLPALQRLTSPAAAELAATLQPMLTTMSQLAGDCVAGDYAAARTLLPSAVSQQADAQARVDEILDGDA